MSSPLSLADSYSRVADEYALRIFDELGGKPLDRQLLTELAERVRGKGVVCDLGCGPGQVARFLHELGVDVLGVDAAPGMVEQARQLNPGLVFQVGDMLALDVPDGSWIGAAAFYSLIHIPRSDMPQALREIRRVLQPGGWLLAAFHMGSETIHLDEWWERPVQLDFHFFQPQEMVAFLEAAGFTVVDSIERAPYQEVEHPSRRCYILTQKPYDDIQ